RAVHVGRVEEVDAVVERRVHDGPGTRPVDLAAEVVAADPDHRDREAGVAEPAVAHVCPHAGIVPGMAAPRPPALHGYQPANEVEYQLAHARGDPAVYLRVLRTALLYVPVTGPDGGEQAPPAWRHGGSPHVAVFTSLDTMRLKVAGIADAYRV